jgi:hypothetical protein
MRVGLLIALLMAPAGAAGHTGAGSWWSALTAWVADAAAPGSQDSGDGSPTSNGGFIIDPYG